MQLILELPDNVKLDQVVRALKNLGVRGVHILRDKKGVSSIDCSRYQVESFQEIDGVTLQRKFRDEW